MVCILFVGTFGGTSWQNQQHRSFKIRVIYEKSWLDHIAISLNLIAPLFWMKA